MNIFVTGEETVALTAAQIDEVVMRSKVAREQCLVAVKWTGIAVTLAVFSTAARAQVTFQQVTNGLVTYYPLDEVNPDGWTTPDYVGGRDMILFRMDSNDVLPSDRTVGSVSNCFNFDQVGGATAIYYNSTGQDPLTQTGDFLPFCNQLNATMSFWIKSSTQSGARRFFGECDTTGSQGNPVYLWGSSQGADASAHLLFRQEQGTGPGGSTPMSDGSYQLPTPGYYMFVDDTYTTNAVLDGTWHMFTVVIDTNGSVTVYVDGVVDTGPPGRTDLYDNESVCLPHPVTNFYYTTNLYPYVEPPASNPPPNGYVKWMLNFFQSGSTTFGGFKRGTVSEGAVCQIDDISFWNRALSQKEIMFVMTNGLPGIPLFRPPRISSFAASLAEVGEGDVATLSWNVTNADSITISGVGDVTSIGATGSVDVAVNSDQLFTLTATKAGASTSESVNVIVFPGVDSNWHLFQRFDGLYEDTTGGIWTDIFGNRNWYSTCCSYAGFFDRWNVVTLTTGGASNKVLSPRSGYRLDGASAIGFDSPGALAYGNLNSLTIGPNQNRTLFFRFSLRDPRSWIQSHGIYSDMDASIGVTDYNWWMGPEGAAAAPAELLNKGPMVNIVRATSDGTFTHSEPFDLRAYDYDGTGTTSNYSYRASVNAAGLETNVNYMLWMDIENRNTGYDTNTASTTNMPLYSVYVQKQGDTTRTLLFSGFRGNRDFAPPQYAFLQATPVLDKFFANMGPESIANFGAGAYFETNNIIAIDDIYISKNGFESSIPRPLALSSIVRGADDAAITWNSLGSMFQTNTYTVQRKLSMSDANWTSLTNGLPSGGDMTTYVDNTIGAGTSAYYRIVWP